MRCTILTEDSPFVVDFDVHKEVPCGLSRPVPGAVGFAAPVRLADAYVLVV